MNFCNSRFGVDDKCHWFDAIGWMMGGASGLQKLFMRFPKLAVRKSHGWTDVS